MFNVLVQLLDDGRLTDAQGRTVDFKNTVVIMTSNIGSPLLIDGVGADGEIRAEVQQVMLELPSYFRPEFLNRVDDLVLFKPLRLEEIKEVVGLMVEELRQRLQDRRIDVVLSEVAQEFIAREGCDSVYGARPLRRYLQHAVETRIGRALIAGDVVDGAEIAVDVEDGGLVVRHENMLPNGEGHSAEEAVDAEFVEV